MTVSDMDVLLADLRALPGETEWVEFKVNDSEPEEIGENISALSNSAALHGKPAAYIVWGVEDKDHGVVGTSFRPRSRKIGNEDLEAWLTRLLVPRVHFSIHEFASGSSRVVIFEVQPCAHTPVRWREHEYIRVGSYRKKLRDYPEKERAF